MFYPGIWIIFGITLIAVVTCSATNQDCIDKTPDCLSPEARVAICSHEKTRVFCMKSCNLCPVDGVWNNWSSWSVCSETCGVGNMNRTRTCHFESGKPHGRVCQGPANETKLCLLQRCPVDGILEDWSDWSPCSVTCGGGQTRRVRICLFPEPTNRGNDCHGTRKETESCATHSCPVDGVWIHWSRWSSCTVTCGGGQKRRDRTCNYPDPTNRGKDCQGVKHEVHPCSTQKCPVDAVWNRWSSWSSCTLTCGGGQSRRTRTCHYPDPTNRGRDCRGTKMETHKCSTQKCPVDGVWNHWSSWSSCTLTCGGGQSRRTRTCHYPDPTNRGRDCRGTKMETHKCSTQKCPVDGTWSDWSKWSYCSASCGGGNKRRHRTCRFPPNSVKGKQCLGVNTEVEGCSMMSCPEAECQSRGGQCQGIEDYCHGYHREGICTTGSHCCIQMDDSEFVGCFGHLQIWGIDIGSSFSHNIDTRWFFYPGNMTIQYCIQHCKSFNMNYAALENESKCECSDTIPHKCHKITNEDCTLRCGGDRATVCGDRGKVSLYRIL